MCKLFIVYNLTYINLEEDFIMSKKWRIYCNEPGYEGYKYTWSDTIPIECPKNPGHSIDTKGIVIVGKEKPLIRIFPHTTKVRGSNYTEVAACNFNPGDYEGELRRVKVLSYLDIGATSYDIEVFDRNNNVQLIENNFANMSNEVEEKFTDPISSPPSSNTVLGINIKKTGGSNKNYVHISEIIFYFG